MKQGEYIYINIYIYIYIFKKARGDGEGIGENFFYNLFMSIESYLLE